MGESPQVAAELDDEDLLAMMPTEQADKGKPDRKAGTQSHGTHRVSRATNERSSS